MNRLQRLFNIKNLARAAIVAVGLWLLVIAGLAVAIFVTGEAGNAADDADVIIVLGSGLRRDGRPGDALTRRSLWAADLYHEGVAPALICTGGIGEGQRRSEADACRELLVRSGVPAEAITLDEQSRSTEENALYAREIMRANDWRDAILVTDSFHMFRANWIFDLYFDASGIAHTRSPVPRAQVRSYHYTRHFLREIVALHWQAFKETFNLDVTNVN